MSLLGSSNRFLTTVAIQAKKQSICVSQIARLLCQKLPRNDKSGVLLRSLRQNKNSARMQSFVINTFPVFCKMMIQMMAMLVFRKVSFVWAVVSLMLYFYQRFE